jgi:hypothetical protein
MEARRYAVEKQMRRAQRGLFFLALLYIDALIID